MNYKCNNGFSSANGKRYSYGDKIGSLEYHGLRGNEQSNFFLEIEESYSAPVSNDTYTPPPSYDYGSSLDSGSSASDSSSSDFGGFSGGDSGGGGASGDW